MWVCAIAAATRAACDPGRLPHAANSISSLMLTDAERAAIRDAARRTAANMPPLDEEQRSALRVLLAPVRVRRRPSKPSRDRRPKPPDAP